MQHKAFTRPLTVMIWMGLFLGGVLLLVALLLPQLAYAFLANPAFNGVIMLVLFIGVLVNFRQVWRLKREVNWVSEYQRGELMHADPVLLAPMAKSLAGHEHDSLKLTSLSARSMLDSVQSRLDEQRDLSRYLIGLLIFLGLLGTFWGLLVTIRSVGDIISGMHVGSDALVMFETLKQRLDEPLGGMATSFSTSLFGLAGSLVLGFLDLQSAHAQNRFYNELEDWLSNLTSVTSVTSVTSMSSSTSGNEEVPTAMLTLMDQHAQGLERMRRLIVASDRERRGLVEQLGILNSQLTRMGDLMSNEAHTSTSLLATQDDLRNLLRQIQSKQATGNGVSDELRNELRLMTRTIAAALKPGEADT
jgi:hypothetical protein